MSEETTTTTQPNGTGEPVVETVDLAKIENFQDYETVRNRQEKEGGNIKFTTTEPNPAEVAPADGEGKTPSPDGKPAEAAPPQEPGEETGKPSQTPAASTTPDPGTGTPEAKPESDEITRRVVQSRLERQQRQHKKTTDQLTSENATLKAQLEAVRSQQTPTPAADPPPATPAEPGATVDGQVTPPAETKPDIPYPNIDDYDDMAKWEKDLDAWANNDDDKIAGGERTPPAAKASPPATPAKATPAAPAKADPPLSPDQQKAASLVMDLQEIVEGDDGVSDTLWDDVMAGADTNKIQISDEMLQVLADEDSVVEYAPKILEKFVEKPVLSRRIYRKTPGEQVKAMLQMVAEIKNPGSSTPNKDKGTADVVPPIKPISGDASTPGDVDIYDKSLSFSEFERRKNAELNQARKKNEELNGSYSARQRGN